MGGITLFSVSDYFFCHSIFNYIQYLYFILILLYILSVGFLVFDAVLKKLKRLKDSIILEYGLHRHEKMMHQPDPGSCQISLY